METDLLKTQITNELQKLDLKTNNLNENDSVLMDSLIEQSLSHGYTELLIRLIIHKCTYLSDIGDFDKAFSLINDALQLSKKYNSSNLMGDSTLKSGVLYFRQGNFEKALLNFFESLELFKSTDNTEKIGIVTRNIGVVYQRSGDYLKSFQYLQKALKLAKEHQFKELQASTLSWLGILESCYENYEAAINYYIESTALFEELKDIYNIAVNLNSIGLAYTIYNAELAHGYLKQAEDIARKDNNNFVLADVLHNYGLTFSEQKEYDKALEKYFESIEYRKKAMSKDKLSHTYTNIGNIYCIQGKYDLGLEYLNKGLKIREEANYQIRMVASYYDIAFCYLDSKQYDNAIEMCNKALE
ncbi:MAG: tetratricopeptide repeat protein, partial [Candidatus Cloacimonadales bacterium]|nr:tetratricopeptide repeat protein [Candidatus Cloacimonadales bacterium]